MVEPLRKQLTAQSNVRPIYPDMKTHSLVLATTHATRPARVDFQSLRNGDSRPARTRWNGPFSGRPLLIAQLMPVIRARYQDAPQKTVNRLLHTLRLYWRLLDRHDGVGRVQSVADLQDLHGAIQLREGVDRANTQIFLLIVNDARLSLGLPRLFWPVNEDRSSPADLPDRLHVARIYQFIKRRAYEAIDRIEASLGKGLDSTPSRTEAWHLFVLFLLRSGWNRQTAMDLDMGSCLLPHPTSEAHHVVRSIKARGNTEQIAIGLNKSALSPGNILRLVARATKPLRDQVQNALDELGPLPKAGDMAAHRIRRARLEMLARTPWLIPGSGQPSTFNESQNLASILESINASLPSGQQLPASITLSDLRDAYIAFAYEYSGYSWMVAKVAAGHQSLESLKAYLRQRQWKAHGERKVLRFGEALWTSVSERRIVDGALLHAMVEKLEVSEAQISRWLAMKDRTRVGMGCKDFNEPPAYIAPHHTAGAGCRVQRCTLCSHAVLFDDSVDLLARRVAELMHIKTTIPLVTWLESSFDDELIATQKHLTRFDAAAVDGLVKHWQNAITSGQHRVVHMEGSYGL